MGSTFLLGSKASSMESYVGVIGPFAGFGLDSNSNAATTSYLVGDRFESVSLENNISFVVNMLAGLGVEFPNSSQFTITGSGASLYVYVGGIMRYEDYFFKFGDDGNSTGLYYAIGVGAYYGKAMNLALNGSQVELNAVEQASFNNATQVIDPVINASIKLLLDFNQSFGIYPFIDYELLPFRSYFKIGYTDTKLKHRFYVGCGFAFEWWK